MTTLSTFPYPDLCERLHLRITLACRAKGLDERLEARARFGKVIERLTISEANQLLAIIRAVPVVARKRLQERG